MFRSLAFQQHRLFVCLYKQFPWDKLTALESYLPELRAAGELTLAESHNNPHFDTVPSVLYHYVSNHGDTRC